MESQQKVWVEVDDEDAWALATVEERWPNPAHARVPSPSASQRPGGEAEAFGSMQGFGTGIMMD